MSLIMKTNTVCQRWVYACHNYTSVSRERVESNRLTRMIVGFPDPLIPHIASRVTVALTVSYT